MKERAPQIKTFLPAVYLAAKSPKTPRKTKILAVCTAAYALSPIDLIPNFIPVLGYLDDLIILPTMITWTIHSMDKDLFSAFMEEAKVQRDTHSQKKWVYAIPTILIYLLIVYFILKTFMH